MSNDLNSLLDALHSAVDVVNAAETVVADTVRTIISDAMRQHGIQYLSFSVPAQFEHGPREVEVDDIYNRRGQFVDNDGINDALEEAIGDLPWAALDCFVRTNFGGEIDLADPVQDAA